MRSMLTGRTETIAASTSGTDSVVSMATITSPSCIQPRTVLTRWPAVADVHGRSHTLWRSPLSRHRRRPERAAAASPYPEGRSVSKRRIVGASRDGTGIVVLQARSQTKVSEGDGEAGAPPSPLPLPCEQPAGARWGGAQATRRPAQGADRQHQGTRCLEGHHALGAQRVHLLGRGCQAADDPRTPHSPDPGGAGGRPATALLLAGVQAPRPHRQVAGLVSGIPAVVHRIGHPVALHRLVSKANGYRRAFRTPGRSLAPPRA